MGAVFVAIAHVFRDFGVSSYLKREATINDEIIRSASGLLITSSWIVAATVFLSAPLWGALFSEPKVADVVRVLALGFVFIPFGAIPEALLTREYEVATLAKVSAVVVSIYCATSLSLAWLNFGHMTMAWANLVNIIATGIAYRWIMRARLPLLPSIHGWGRMLNFGFGNLVTAILKACDNALPDILLGRLGNPTLVGLFSRANSTVNLLNTAITPTIQFFALPYLAKLHHATGNMDREYLHASSIIQCVLLPALAGIAIMAPEIVMFLYGPQWQGSIPVIPWLCAVFALPATFMLTTAAVTGQGRPYAVAVPLLLTLAAKIGGVLWLFDSTLIGFAKGLLLGQVIATPAYIWVNWRYLSVSPISWASNLLRVAPPIGVAVLLTLATKAAWLSQLPVLLSLIAAVILFSTSIVLTYLLTRLPIRNEILRVGKLLLKKHD